MNKNTSSNTPPYEMLNLDNQLCFALYVCSKEIIRKYKPLLEPLNLTYTGYITLLALWEKDKVTINELGKRLYLDSGTLTPLSKKLEGLGYIARKRSTSDERNVYITVTDKGYQLKEKAVSIPHDLICDTNLDIENASQILSNLHQIIERLSDSSKI
jgi:MarR family transcriptional regulator, organic hydroperoxide resistance regulator